MPLSQASTKGVSVTANRVFHARIIKAVGKEKWFDVGFKLQQEPIKLVLKTVSKGDTLTFFLVLLPPVITSDYL